LAVGEGPFNLPLLPASDLRGSTLLLVVVVVVVVVTGSAEFSSLFLYRNARDYYTSTYIPSK
jgi:hypothetical protein